MKKNKAFTLIEVMVSLALFAMVSVMLMSLLNFATSSTTETERAAEVVSNSSTTKELLVKTISPSTSIEILNPISTNDLTGYINELNATGEDDKQYTYLYSIDGVVYYRNPGDATKGKEIKTISTTDIDLGFAVNNKSNKMLDINMTFGTKEIEPYVTDDMLSIAPLNFGKDEVVKDDRSNKSTPSNIIRFISEEIIPEPETYDGPMIISATVQNVPITGSPNSVYDVPFYISQEPRVAQLYNIPTLADKGDQIKTDDWIGSKPEIDRADYYFKNTVIQQSTFLDKEPASKEVVFVYKGYTFIDIYGNEYVGTENDDGTRTINYKIPTYQPTDQMKFAVMSKDGGYNSYDFKVVNEITQPEIVRFEFLTEDNYQGKELGNKPNNQLPYKLKTYINQNDVYYAKKTSAPVIADTYGASRPAMYADLNLGTQTIKDNEDFYSTIVMPTNREKYGRGSDFYPNINDTAAHNGNDTRYLNSRVATITFKGTGLVAPNGKKIPVPQSEASKLNGVEEVSVKVTVDRDYRGNKNILDGEIIGENYLAYIPDGVDTTDWFDPKNLTSAGDSSYSVYDGKGAIFTALNGNVTKRYTYQHEYNTAKPDYHKGTIVDSGLSRVWVDGYPDGAWVGGSMRDDVSGDVVVTVPYNEYNTIRNKLTLNLSAYGEHLVQLPSYVLGRYNTPSSTGTDSYSYYDLNSNAKDDVKIQIQSSSPQASTRYDADYIKHFLLLQGYKSYSPLARYQVSVEKSYPKNMLEPQINSIKIYDNTIAEDKERLYIKNEGTFTPHSDMYSVYGIGQNVNMDISFTGSKIAIGNSINPNECDVFENNLSNKDCYYNLKLSRIPFGKTMYIHLYDYDGDLKETYKIMPNTTIDFNKRVTSVYDIDSEMGRSIVLPTDDTSYTTLPFLPVKTKTPGISYGYDSQNVRETPIQVTHLNKYDANAPLPYGGGTSIDTSFDIQYADKNLADYTITGEDGKSEIKKRMYMRSTRTDYSVGGNNLNTASQYSIGNFMTPVLINESHKMYVDDTGNDYISQPYNTDEWVGTGTERPNFEPSNVKLDTTGFSMQIFNDRVYDDLVNIKPHVCSTGRPGAVAETTYDIALVDTTTNRFNNEAYLPTGTGTNAENADYAYSMLYSKLAIPKEIQTNDVIGYGFSLIEQEVDRDPTQDYLGTVAIEGEELNKATPERTDRKVSLMFYTRQFFAGENDKAFGKAPASYVKIADLTGFNMQGNNGRDIIDSQAVNFVVDVKTTYDGETIVTKNNYDSIMKNNYIEFTVTELDIQNNPTGIVHYKKYSFADVFGGVRIDDEVSDSEGYNELNLLLNQRPRIIDGDNSNRKTRLSVGYGTNWGLVGISDFKIMR